MKTKTISEDLFERACDGLGIPWQREIEGEEKTPDYRLTIAGVTVIAEVKQLDRTPDDKRALATLEKTRSTYIWPGTEDRLRRKIKGSNQQLKKRTVGTHPGLTVIYCNTPFGWFNGVDVRGAMFGSESYVALRDEPKTLGPFLGPDGELKEARNTSTSAIVAIGENPERGMCLDFYHNPYAAVPFDPNWLQAPNVRHFVRHDDPDRSLPVWRMV